MVYVLDKSGQPLSTTTRHGKVRRLLKEHKARVVKDCPFTIQLLYDGTIDDIVEDNLMGKIKHNNTLNKKVNTVVTNDARWPKDFDPISSEKITYKEFVELASSDGGIEFEHLWLDIDGLTPEIYEAIMVYKNKDITFFRYNTIPYINAPVEILEAQSRPVKDPLQINFSDKVEDLCVCEGNLLICGRPGYGKTVLANSIAQQLYKKGVEVTYISPIQSVRRYDYMEALAIDNVNALIKLVEDFRLEMMNRFKLMEKQWVNNYLKLQYPPTPKCLIIDDLSYYTTTDQNKMGEYHNALSALVRLCKKSGIMIILICQEPSKEILPLNMSSFIDNRVVVGTFNSTLSYLVFDKDLEIKNMPIGTGIFKSSSSSQYIFFDVDKVKNY